MSIITAIFLGLVQGVTEFLPVSSSGHLSIFQNLFHLNYEESEHLFFDVLLHLGTLIAVGFVYREELLRMIKETVAFAAGKSDTEYGEDGRFTPSVRNVFLLLVSTLPLILVLPFYSKVETLYYKTGFIGIALLVTGGLLYVADKISVGRKNEKTATIMDAVLVGIGQAIAVIPGLSRSGTTITVALSRGYRRDYAVKFSFLLSIPAVLGSFLVSLMDAFRAGITWSLIPVYLVGMVVATVSGYFAIRLVKYLVDNSKFGKISYYCWGMGVLTIILSLIF